MADQGDSRRPKQTAMIQDDFSSSLRLAACHYCETVFRRMQGLAAHLYYLHVRNSVEAEIPLYSCEICSDFFRNNAPFLRHLQDVHFIAIREANESDLKKYLLKKRKFV